MSRTENASGKIQGYSLPEIRDGLRMATTRLSRFIERAPGKRPIEYGLALSRLAAWFLVQDLETQRRIIQQGNAIVDDLMERNGPQPPLDGEIASEMRSRHKGAVVERWLQSSNLPISESGDVGVSDGRRKPKRKV